MEVNISAKVSLAAAVQVILWAHPSDNCYLTGTRVEKEEDQVNQVYQSECENVSVEKVVFQFSHRHPSIRMTVQIQQMK